MVVKNTYESSCAQECIPSFLPFVFVRNSLKAEDRKSEELTLIANFSQSLNVIRYKALGVFAPKVCFCKKELIVLPGRSGVGLQK